MGATAVELSGVAQSDGTWIVAVDRKFALPAIMQPPTIKDRTVSNPGQVNGVPAGHRLSACPGA